MADENQDNILSATFPAPPPFYKHFTPENRARLKELQDAAKAKGTSAGEESQQSEGDAIKLPDLPAELRYLVPPEPPTSGKYRSFGDHYDINEPLPSLKDMGIEQLYPSAPETETPASPSSGAGTQSQWTHDRAFYLKKMTQSLLLNFLEFVGVLSINPGLWHDKFQDIETLLLNCHHLINEYRPHQARATLITMMEDQLNKKREEVEGVRRMREKIEGVLAGLEREAVEAGEVSLDQKQEEMVDAEELRRKEQRAVLRALDEELAFD
ncbi:uncharacterized protein K452DRAFT_237669 [Aplosporella prunicola CBS 121167]|uniref:Mediator of RNA polymerase II transcription subunit 7 n=1 Tax=Aplosporella prunicola CBS 121167 TaxID=1176127 RepID=A0A6A6AYR8_9PEZI|nr:uncharacterized protein K452DRAFT_237669 [Aplosporella prunicola CBS 121167]KAF2136333.1 hypothetical protein K452DRAFT_237669 [Aplosporella prunicola CBS 121167]